ncbi:MAG TPA: helix-hairpin-helix domain-containing protein, partial [Anaerolineales bacterium]|nr:helix-hairpin-helix domain-containing protein [Anaerolineales bacterium]
MNNKQLADTFTLIANLLEIKGEIIYKILAYRKAAESLQALGREAGDYWKEGNLSEIPGVGKAIAEKIDELLSTGKLQFLENLKKEVPESLADWLQVPSLGPKKISMIWKALNITTLAELESAAKEGKLRDMPGMGAKSEAAILDG